jgi:MFS family permease
VLQKSSISSIMSFSKSNKKLDRNLILVISLGTITTSFDSSAIGTVLPVIIHQFHSNLQTGKWIISLYVLVICSLLLLSGHLGDIFGHRQIYIIGLTICFFGALLCSTAISINFLVFFRTIEAVGITLILANGIALLTKHCSFAKRGRMLGVLSTMAYVGLISGTSLSGWLLNVFGWRSIFVVVMSLAVLTLFLCVTILPGQESKSNVVKPFSIIRTTLWVISLSALVLAFHWSNSLGWQSLKVLCFLIGGLITFLVTVVWTLSQKTGFVFNQLIIIAAIASFLTYVSLYSITFILPFYILEGKAIQVAKKVGYVLGLRPLLTALVTLISGALADRYNNRSLSVLGLLILIGAFVSFTYVNSTLDIFNVGLLLGVIGIGMGIFLPPNHNMIMGTALSTDKGISSATISLTRNLGMLIGVSLGSAFSQTTLKNQVGHSVFYISTFIAAVAFIIMLISGISSFLKEKNGSASVLIKLH